MHFVRNSTINSINSINMNRGEIRDSCETNSEVQKREDIEESRNRFTKRREEGIGANGIVRAALRVRTSEAKFVRGLIVRSQTKGG
jgi:hypothetical protein